MQPHLTHLETFWPVLSLNVLDTDALSLENVK